MSFRPDGLQRSGGDHRSAHASLRLAAKGRAGAAALRRASVEAIGFLAALALMLAAAILLRLAPTGRLLRATGRQLGAVACVPLTNARQEARARLARRSIRRAARVSPLRSDCLPQALAAATLCRLLKAPAALHLGVRRAAGGHGQRPLEAHAWVASGRVAVSGGDGCESFVAVACFFSGPSFGIDAQPLRRAPDSSTTPS